jgi:cytochrome P450
MSNATVAEAPANVPPELIRDFDFNRVPGAEQDVYSAWNALHAGPDIFWTPRYGGHWVLTRAEDIEVVQQDATRYSHEVMTLPRDSKPFKTVPIQYDPPEHTPLRMLLNQAFSPKRVAGLNDKIRAWCVELIEAFAARGECEFMADFAKQFPIGIFLQLMDLPWSERETFVGWAENSVRTSDAEKRRATYIQIAEYLQRVIDERRANPGDDMISALITGSVEGRPLTGQELIGMTTLLFVGGLDTVAGQLGFITAHLAAHPEDRRRLREHPELIPNAIEEFLRRHGMSNTVRLVTEDVAYKGLTFRKGDLVMVPISLHGMDPRRWDAPMEVRFDRADARAHDTFGKGPHRCAGAHLARAEIRIFLEEWLKRIPEFRIKDGEAARYLTGGVNGVASLPLSWEAK